VSALKNQCGSERLVKALANRYLQLLIAVTGMHATRNEGIFRNKKKEERLGD
jgi:hypothetical protein